MSPELLKARVPHAEIVADIEARENVYVTQIVGKTFGKVEMEKNEAALDKAWLAALGEVRLRGGNWLIVTHKYAEDQITLRHKIQSFIQLAHFGAVEGRDEWGDVDGVLILGRMQLPPYGAERIAGIISGQAVSPIEGWYPSSMETIHARNGMAVTVEADHHPDALADAIREQTCVGQIIQAIGRGRAVNRHEAASLQVILMNNVPTITPDVIKEWHIPNKEERAFAETGKAPRMRGFNGNKDA